MTVVSAKLHGRFCEGSRRATDGCTVILKPPEDGGGLL
jgi:hypothetical protein